MKKEPIVTYRHHGNLVSVKKSMMGKHRKHCLCHSCSRFTPEDREANCKIANLLYYLDRAFGVTTPVWECPEFKEV